MRTTLAIDDDVLGAAKEMAAAQKRTVGEIISELARHSLAPPSSRSRVRNGIRLLPGAPAGQRVTSELVRQLQEELP